MIAGLVLLLSATNSVVGTGGEALIAIQRVSVATTVDDSTSTECPAECVNEQEMGPVKQELAAVKQELAAVKVEMERRVDQLHSQLQFWQNVTVNILKDHFASFNTGKHKTSKTNNDRFQHSTFYP